MYGISALAATNGYHADSSIISMVSVVRVASGIDILFLEKQGNQLVDLINSLNGHP